jgi:predicted negative regulator of RcsB-dependent stress response
MWFESYVCSLLSLNVVSFALKVVLSVRIFMGYRFHSQRQTGRQSELQLEQIILGIHCDCPSDPVN